MNVMEQYLRLAQRHTPWAMEARLTAVERRLGRFMSASSEAYARLDAQIEALRVYVNSDDETDAGEVDRRADELRALLAEVVPPAEPVEEPPVG